MAVFEIDRANNTIHLRAAASTDAANRSAPQVDWSIADLGLFARRGQSQLDPTATDVSSPTAYSDASGLAVFPISVGGMIRYVLVVPGRNGVSLDAADTTVLSTLTEHVGIALANADLYRQLRGALLVREQILQNVSHELRTPLTLISGYSELLAERESLPATATEMLNIIAEQTEHLASLVNQLLTFQSIESERVVLELMLADQWLESQVTTWRPILERAGLRLEVKGAGEPIVIQGSWDFLNEVMQNLLDNAAQVQPGGRNRHDRGCSRRF